MVEIAFAGAAAHHLPTGRHRGFIAHHKIGGCTNDERFDRRLVYNWMM